MSKWVITVSTRLFVVMALVLGGFAPASAHAAMARASGASMMTMMPGMAMHHEPADKPGKHMPCCGDDGCCVAGSCAISLPPLGVTLAQPAGPASEINFDTALRAGITFPPSLRPPILRG
jgi:hypothetical protein